MYRRCDIATLPAAIAWLCRTFGFEQHLVVTGDDGSVRYAQLTFGEGMVMVVPVEDTAFDQLMKQPEEAGGAETQICYLFVEDVGAHYTRAKAGGAEILLDIEDADSQRARLFVPRSRGPYLELRHL